MQKHDVKLAKFTIEFDWTRNGRQLTGWNTVERQYFTDYDCHRQITDPQQLALIRASGLERELSAVAIGGAKNANWFEYPNSDHGIGYTQIFLADNEWLPVASPRSLQAYETGTTPLMHAAILGDVGRIKRELEQEHNINATSPDGSTALIYAAASENAEAVEYLLRAGADVNATMKGGGNALTTAVLTHHQNNVSVLLRYGADPDSVTPEGETVLAASQRLHFTSITRLLRGAGAHQ